MRGRSKGKVYPILLEIGKWGLVVWLVWPLAQATRTPVEFGRIALGVALFVVFAGKLLYDEVCFPMQRRRAEGVGRDFVAMLAMVVVIALVVGLLVLFILLFVVNYMRSVQV